MSGPMPRGVPSKNDLWLPAIAFALCFMLIGAVIAWGVSGNVCS